MALQARATGALAGGLALCKDSRVLHQFQGNLRRTKTHHGDQQGLMVQLQRQANQATYETHGPPVGHPTKAEELY